MSDNFDGGMAVHNKILDDLSYYENECERLCKEYSKIEIKIKELQSENERLREENKVFWEEILRWRNSGKDDETVTYSWD